MWGTEAEEFDGSSNPVVAIKGARIGEFNGGKNLSAISSTVIQVEPDIPEAHRCSNFSIGLLEILLNKLLYKLFCFNLDYVAGLKQLVVMKT